jgi:hypothetical protein
MQLLLVTGAGASRELNAGADPIVLMDGWAEALRSEFGPALSELLGLHNVRTAQEFEQHLGDLMRWLELHSFNERFAWMTSGIDQGRDDVVNQFLRALENGRSRGDRLERALDQSLFRQCGPSRFDVDVAATAYNYLLCNVTGTGDWPTSLICATTNYDRSLELALAKLDRRMRTGFAYDGIHVPTLRADDLGTFADDPSVLYLHGAVGWHRTEDGDVVAYPADQFRPEIGRPAVLYPSKGKAIEDSVVSGLWAELEAALDQASHVLVLGHGLGDDHLVSRLARTRASLAVTYYRDSDLATVEKLLPHAAAVEMAFGPTPTWDVAAVRGWANT